MTVQNKVWDNTSIIVDGDIFSDCMSILSMTDGQETRFISFRIVFRSGRAVLLQVEFDGNSEAQNGTSYTQSSRTELCSAAPGALCSPDTPARRLSLNTRFCNQYYACHLLMYFVCLVLWRYYQRIWCLFIIYLYYTFDIEFIHIILKE